MLLIRKILYLLKALPKDTYLQNLFVQYVAKLIILFLVFLILTLGSIKIF